MDTKELPQIEDLFLPGLSGAVLLGGNMPTTKIFALYCDFEVHCSSVLQLVYLVIFSNETVVVATRATLVMPLALEVLVP